MPSKWDYIPRAASRNRALNCAGITANDLVAGENLILVHCSYLGASSTNVDQKYHNYQSIKTALSVFAANFRVLAQNPRSFAPEPAIFSLQRCNSVLILTRVVLCAWANIAIITEIFP